MKTHYRLLAWLALLGCASSALSAEAPALPRIFYDQRIPRQEFGPAPAPAERAYMIQAMQKLPMACGVKESASTHQDHEQAFRRALGSYRGKMQAERVIGHILMTDRGLSEAQMVTMVAMLGSMQTADAVAVLRNLKRWSGVLAWRFVAENVPRAQQQLVKNGIERSLQNSLNATAGRYRLTL